MAKRDGRISRRSTMRAPVTASEPRTPLGPAQEREAAPHHSPQVVRSEPAGVALGPRRVEVWTWGTAGRGRGRAAEHPTRPLGASRSGVYQAGVVGGVSVRLEEASPLRSRRSRGGQVRRRGECSLPSRWRRRPRRSACEPHRRSTPAPRPRGSQGPSPPAIGRRPPSATCRCPVRGCRRASRGATATWPSRSATWRDRSRF